MYGPTMAEARRVNRGLCKLFLDGVLVLRPLLLVCHTCWCPCFSVVLESTHKASQGSETETRELPGGTQKKSISLTRGQSIRVQANQWYFYEKEPEKNWVNGQTCQIHLENQSRYTIKNLAAYHLLQSEEKFWQAKVFASKWLWMTYRMVNFKQGLLQSIMVGLYQLSTWGKELPKGME